MMAGRLFAQAAPPLTGFTSPRAWAFGLISIHEYLRRLNGDSMVKQIRLATAECAFGFWKEPMSSPAKAAPTAVAVPVLVYAAAISALGGMLFGYDIGVISGAILFIKKQFSLSSGMKEIVVSSVLLGSLIGAAAGGVLADRLGRRRLSIVTAIVFCLGAAGAALAPDTVFVGCCSPVIGNRENGCIDGCLVFVPDLDNVPVRLRD